MEATMQSREKTVGKKKRQKIEAEVERWIKEWQWGLQPREMRKKKTEIHIFLNQYIVGMWTLGKSLSRQ